MLRFSFQDTSKIVRESVEHGKPIIVVSIQYRLNLFHVGDGQGTKNLGFKDQQVAVQWVKEHIPGFGGDSVSTYHEQVYTSMLMSKV